MNALHACDVAYLYVKQSFFWNQLAQQDRNIRTERVTISHKPVLVLRLCYVAVTSYSTDSDRPHGYVCGQNVSNILRETSCQMNVR